VVNQSRSDSEGQKSFVQTNAVKNTIEKSEKLLSFVLSVAKNFKEGEGHIVLMNAKI
jgi:hypothetical protein